MFDAQTWADVPFHFWSLVFFVLGSIVGSLLNVCIHRMPLGQSIVTPRSHCPHCGYAIPWHLNIPLASWLILRGRCAQCQAPISPRYFLVELLTAIAFVGCWLRFGHHHPAVALVACLFLAGLIAATFIDFEHFIIPDEITKGGMIAGFALSALVPHLHGTPSRTRALESSFLGIIVGAAIIYAILRLGKLLFGKQHFQLEPGTRVIFTEETLLLPHQEIPYDEIFYRKTDAIQLQAQTVELSDRCYWNVTVELKPDLLRIGDETFNPEDIKRMEVTTNSLLVPREAMGLGDVKFMAAIGAFLGWKAIFFILMLSAMLGSAVGITGILLRKQVWSSRLPYGPYIATAAVVWLLCGPRLVSWWLH